MHKIIIFLSLLLFLASCNSEKEIDSTASDADLNNAYCTLNLCPSGPPSGLNYVGTASLQLTKDVIISELVPTFAPNFYLYSFRVNPQLPPGLSLNSSTGRIFGTPTLAAEERTYRVILDNRLVGEEVIIAGGIAVYDLKITVNEKAPKQFDYLLRDEKSQYQSLKGQSDSIPRPNPITTLTIDRNVNMQPLELSNHDIGIMTCLVSVNGVLRPSPNSALTTSEFASLSNNFLCRKKGVNIECQNDGISSAIKLECTRQEDIMNIDLDTVKYAYTYCDKYSANKILDCRELGKSATNYSVSPSLPDGLIFNSINGRIFGSPVTEQLSSSYRITVSNSGGSKFYDLNIIIRGYAPNELSYLSPNSIYKAGLDIIKNNPIYSGDTATSYSIFPTLPSGLEFNTLTGFISGNPGQIVSNNTYTATATNMWGSTTANLIISVIDNVSDLSVGEHHSCAVRNKLASCWGKNDKGQLGYSSASVCSGIDCSLVPKNVRKESNLLPSKKVSTSLNTSCAILLDNRVACWGNNSLGQLGTDSADIISQEPQFVDIDSEDNNLTNVQKIVAGKNHFCALTTAGDVWCWGDNNLGQISITGVTSALFAFKTIGSSGAGFLSGIKDLSAGFNHNCAVNQENKVYCWGVNDSGQFGSGDFISSSLPIKMLSSAETDFINAKRIFAGSNFSLIEKTDNLIYAVGNNDYNQLASNSSSVIFPQLTKSSNLDEMPLSNLTDIKTGLNSFCFLKNKLASCIGQNNSDFGNNTNITFSQNPTIVRNANDSDNLENIDVLSNGFGSHRCVSIVGNAYCFGNNEFGQLGNNSIINAVFPSLVDFN